MPIYEYKCRKCGNRDEAVRPMEDRAKPLPCSRGSKCAGRMVLIPSVPMKSGPIDWH